MTRLVKFIEHTEGSERYREKAKRRGRLDTYLIDPDHVGLVIPHTTYTSIRVNGWWVHVDHYLPEVLEKLGFEAEL